MEISNYESLSNETNLNILIGIVSCECYVSSSHLEGILNNYV